MPQPPSPISSASAPRRPRAVQRGIANGSRLLVARARIQEGRALGEMGEPEKATLVLQEARGIYTEAGHRRGESLALSALASVRMRLGDMDSSRQLHEESLAISRKFGNKTGIASSLNNTGSDSETERRL